MHRQRRNLSEIEEEPVESRLLLEVEMKVYVTVGEDLKESTSILKWALKNACTNKKLVLVYLYRPSQKIGLNGARFSVSWANEQMVEAHRQQEREKIDKILSDFLHICSQAQVQAERKVIVIDDVVKGLVDLISEAKINKLVMGVAIDNLNQMNDQKSKKAISIQKQAHPSCKIWYVRKEEVMWTREAVMEGVENVQSLTIESYTTSPSEQFKSRSSQHGHGNLSNLHPEELHRSKSTGQVKTSPVAISMSRTELIIEEGDDDLCDENSRRSSSSDTSFLSATNEAEHGAEEDHQFSPPHHQMEICELFQDFEKMFLNLKQKVNEESLRCHQKAEWDARMVVDKAQASRSLPNNETKKRKDIEEKLRRTVMEVEVLRNQQDEALQEFQRKHEDLQRQRDSAIKEAEELRQKIEEVTMSTHVLKYFSEISRSELEEATENFNQSLRIGEGGYGTVYKGVLRHTTVAIKKLNLGSEQGQPEFYQEVCVLSRVRHPNIVTLIGACLELCALVYEFVPNGNLEDHLVCKDNTPPLTWQVRTSIIKQIRLTLIFLHSHKPHGVVHGDIKPANVLLDANFRIKLGDLGISRFLVQSNSNNTYYRRTTPKGTLAYMDPQFLAMGELTSSSDVYSFGIIILRLLTGKPAFGVLKHVQDAQKEGHLHEMLDDLAGTWPPELAKKLAELGLRCCKLDRSIRQDLLGEEWRQLDPPTTDTSSSTPSNSSSLSQPTTLASHPTSSAQSVRPLPRLGWKLFTRQIKKN